MKLPIYNRVVVTQDVRWLHIIRRYYYINQKNHYIVSNWCEVVKGYHHSLWRYECDDILYLYHTYSALSNNLADLCNNTLTLCEIILNLNISCAYVFVLYISIFHAAGYTGISFPCVGLVLLHIKMLCYDVRIEFEDMAGILLHHGKALLWSLDSVPLRFTPHPEIMWGYSYRIWEDHYVSQETRDTGSE